MEDCFYINDSNLISLGKGANYEESQACTKNEFKQRIAICLREARESNYWYRVLDRLKLGDDDQRKYLLQESLELKLIFGSIHTKCFKGEFDVRI